MYCTEPYFAATNGDLVLLTLVFAVLYGIQ